jgi:hypothetical protein
VLGLLSGLRRKNCWTIAEHAGDATPDGMQHLLAGARWDAAAIRQPMNEAVRDCLVSGYEPLIEGLKLPDPADRHVLAAAIKTGKSDALSPLCPRGRAASTRRERSDCRILLVRALVAQRIEHLTTDRFSFPAVLTRENPDNGRPVCTESDA